MVNTKQLKGKIVASGYTQQKLARETGMSVNSLNAKINGRKIFDAEEVIRISERKMRNFFRLIVPKVG